MVRAVCFLMTLAMLSATGSHGTERGGGKVKTIAWDRDTLVRVRKGGSYARMIRVPGGDILCSHEDGGKAWVVRSPDNGRTWGEPVFAAKAVSGTASNPEMLLLASGRILLFYNERPNDGKHRFTIQVSASDDNGRSWRHLSQAYEADVRFENGCWEPSAIQLPSGEIQLFFANENPYRQSAEQEISLVRSFDNGRTWSPAKAISFRAGHRDGMPVALRLAGGKGLVVAIEDNGYRLEFNAAIIWSSERENWEQSPAGGASPRRWRAVKAPVGSEWGGAPYIRQMPTGETVLSFQSHRGRRQPEMIVYVGDENARNFRGRSVPFQLDPESGGWWNSLFVKDERTITAISTCNGGIYAIDGHIVEE